MHGATALFGHAVALGAAKSVSFDKKNLVLDLEIVLKKC
jgi:hypothetical protein